jgi:dephospho-CoA kinase
MVFLMSKKIAIVLTGLARTGKDTVANIIVENFGFKKIVFSDQIIEEIKKKNLPVTKMNQSIIGDELRQKHGMNAIAKLAWEKAKGFERIVFVGARSVEEISFLKEKIENVFLVNVSSSLKNRVERASSNGSKIESEKILKLRDERDIKKKGLGKVLKLRDFEIKNNSNISDLKEKTIKIVEKILKKTK